MNPFNESVLPSTTKASNSRRVAPGIYLPPPYPNDLITRARIAHLQFPGCVIGGWAAAAYLGLTLEIDDAPLTVISKVKHRKNGSNVRFLNEKSLRPSVCPDPYFPELRISTIPDAAVDCLQDLEKGRHSWWVPRIEGLSATRIRQIQLLDHLRYLKLVDGKALASAADKRFCKARLREIGRLSDPQAQSPRETLLRLILRDIPGIEPQVEIIAPNGQSLTTADLGIPELKFAAFYDGEDHLKREQRDHDSKVWALANQMGWRCFRVTSGMLSDPSWVIAHTQFLVGAALAEKTAKESRMLARTKSGFLLPHH